MSQSLDESKVLLCLEKSLIFLQKCLESVHISRLHAGDDLIIGQESLLEVGVREHLSIRDITHQKLDNDL